MPPTLLAASRDYPGSFGGPDLRELGVALRAGLLAVAQAPQAGLSPCGLPSLTRRSRTSATADPIGSSLSGTRVRLYPLVHAMCTPSMASNGTAMSRSSPASYGKTAFVTPVIVRTTSFLLSNTAAIVARTKDAHLVWHTMLPVKNHPRSRMGFPWFWFGLPRSTRKGFATQACDLFGFACEVTAAAPEHIGACRAGMVPAARREPFNVAQSHPRSEPCLRPGAYADGAGHPLPG